jgi:hypothetical protein
MQTNALPRRPGIFVDTMEGCSSFLESTFGFEKGRDKWGVFKCRIDSVESIKHINFGVMAYRTKEGLFYCNMKPSEVLRVKREICFPSELLDDIKHDIIYATSDDIWLWHVLGVEFTALEGVIWDANMEPSDPYMTYDYSRFVTEMYTKRMENYHVNTLNRGYKLIMNTAYGSSAISMINGMHKIVNVDEDCHVQLAKEYFGTYKLADIVPLGCGKKAMVHMRAKENCVFTELSMKSTIGSRVLSASRRIMFESLFKACDAAGFGYHAALTNAVGYMDTDSFFVTKLLVKGFEEAGLMGNELGQFKNDYEGPIIPIIYMFAPLPKVRRMVILTKKGPKEVYKLKGLPLHRTKEKLDENGEPVLNEKGKVEMEPEIDAKKMFEQLEETFELTQEKEVWERNTRIGCQVYKVPYQIQAPSMMRNKRGIIMTRYSNCYLEKYFPHGRDVGLEDIQTHLDVGIMMFPNEAETRQADLKEVCGEGLNRYKRLRDQFDRPTSVSKRIKLMEEHFYTRKVEEATFNRERLEMGYAM